MERTTSRHCPQRPHRSQRRPQSHAAARWSGQRPDTVRRGHTGHRGVPGATQRHGGADNVQTLSAEVTPVTEASPEPRSGTVERTTSRHCPQRPHRSQRRPRSHGAARWSGQRPDTVRRGHTGHRGVPGATERHGGADNVQTLSAEVTPATGHTGGPAEPRSGTVERTTSRHCPQRPQRSQRRPRSHGAARWSGQRPDTVHRGHTGHRGVPRATERHGGADNIQTLSAEATPVTEASPEPRSGTVERTTSRHCPQRPQRSQRRPRSHGAARWSGQRPDTVRRGHTGHRGVPGATERHGGADNVQTLSAEVTPVTEASPEPRSGTVERTTSRHCPQRSHRSQRRPRSHGAARWSGQRPDTVHRGHTGHRSHRRAGGATQRHGGADNVQTLSAEVTPVTEASPEPRSGTVERTTSRHCPQRPQRSQRRLRSHGAARWSGQRPDTVRRGHTGHTGGPAEPRSGTVERTTSRHCPQRPHRSQRRPRSHGAARWSGQRPDTVRRGHSGHRGVPGATQRHGGADNVQTLSAEVTPVTEASPEPRSGTVERTTSRHCPQRPHRSQRRPRSHAAARWSGQRPDIVRRGHTGHRGVPGATERHGGADNVQTLSAEATPVTEASPEPRSGTVERTTSRHCPQRSHRSQRRPRSHGAARWSGQRPDTVRRGHTGHRSHRRAGGATQRHGGADNVQTLSAEVTPVTEASPEPRSGTVERTTSRHCPQRSHRSQRRPQSHAAARWSGQRPDTVRRGHTGHTGGPAEPRSGTVERTTSRHCPQRPHRSQRRPRSHGAARWSGQRPDTVRRGHSGHRGVPGATERHGGADNVQTLSAEVTPVTEASPEPRSGTVERTTSRHCPQRPHRSQRRPRSHGAARWSGQRPDTVRRGHTGHRGVPGATERHGGADNVQTLSAEATPVTEASPEPRSGTVERTTSRHCPQRSHRPPVTQAGRRSHAAARWSGQRPDTVRRGHTGHRGVPGATERHGGADNVQTLSAEVTPVTEASPEPRSGTVERTTSRHCPQRPHRSQRRPRSHGAARWSGQRPDTVRRGHTGHRSHTTAHL